VQAASRKVARVETAIMKAQLLDHQHTMQDLRAQLGVALGELEHAKQQALEAEGLADGSGHGYHRDR
jgi:hypothetical protein